jgi:hypothetical protein
MNLNGLPQADVDDLGVGSGIRYEQMDMPRPKQRPAPASAPPRVVTATTSPARCAILRAPPSTIVAPWRAQRSNTLSSAGSSRRGARRGRRAVRHDELLHDAYGCRRSEAGQRQAQGHHVVGDDDRHPTSPHLVGQSPLIPAPRPVSTSSGDGGGGAQILTPGPVAPDPDYRPPSRYRQTPETGTVAPNAPCPAHPPPRIRRPPPLRRRRAVDRRWVGRARCPPAPGRAPPRDRRGLGASATR